MYTKYSITEDNLDEVKSKITNCGMSDTKLKSTPDLTRKSELYALNYCYNQGTDYFFPIFEAPNKIGQIVRSKYPNHLVIYEGLYEDKLNKKIII